MVSQVSRHKLQGHHLLARSGQPSSTPHSSNFTAVYCLIVPHTSLFTPRFLNIYVGRPSIEEDMVATDITPQQCRLRDITYAAPITVDIEYTRGKEIVVKKGRNGQGAVCIGRMPLMLRCDRCVRGVQHVSH